LLELVSEPPIGIYLSVGARVSNMTSNPIKGFEISSGKKDKIYYEKVLGEAVKIDL